MASCGISLRSIVEDWLRYVYEGNITLNEYNVERVYLLAFIMDYGELREGCLKFMGST